MVAHVDRLAPPVPLRWLVIPAALWSVAAGAVLILRRRARCPAVSAMSDAWLRSHAAHERPSDY
jgi:hypothetical protein